MEKSKIELNNFNLELSENFEKSNIKEDIFNNGKTRTIVYGVGNTSPAVMLVGEAPGGDEEKQGEPFVGKAGKMLTEFLQGVGIVRDEVYISNVVKVRPTKASPKTGNAINRPPNKEEVEFFLPYLHREVEIVKPLVIVTLGNFALNGICENFMDKNKITIGDYHGEGLILKNNWLIFPMYHPASLIYNRNLESIYKEDLGKLSKFIEQRKEMA